MRRTPRTPNAGKPAPIPEDLLAALRVLTAHLQAADQPPPPETVERQCAFPLHERGCDCCKDGIPPHLMYALD